MGVPLANTRSPLSSLEDGSSSSRSAARRRKSRFGRRSQSMPEDTNIENAIQHKHKSEPRKQSFRLSRPMKLGRRSQSLPIVHSSSETSGDGDPSARGKKRPRRKISLNLLRRGSRTMQVDYCPSDSSKDSKGGSTAEESDEDSLLGASLMSRTRIVPEATTPVSTIDRNEFGNDVVDEEPAPSSFSCATAILRHSYLEMCGVEASLSEDGLPTEALPEDPTVQESIECIFASQLEDGLEMWDDNEAGERFRHGPEGLVSPAAFQQSMQNRSDRNSTSLSQNKQRYQQASLVYVGTFDPTISENPVDCGDDPLPCACARSSLPSCRPQDWPQAPLLLRPSAGSGTRAKGVRFSGSTDYLWEPGSHLTWQEALAREWGRPCEASTRHACCEKCAVLPINNGNEEIGKGLVIDFESDLFEGSLMLRLRHAEGTTAEKYDDNKGYFEGLNRRYQAVVRGRFKKRIPLTELVTGFQFNRPCGKLPAKWVLRGGLKVISFFAPQLDANLEGSKPHCVTPLGSTPQSIAVEDEARDLIDGIREEPVVADKTLLGNASVATASIQRARNRKKAFDKLFVHRAKNPTTDPSKTYTFEFLQHLFNFQDFSIELGSMLGSVHLEEILDGQPLQIMAAHGEQPLFSFDVWHECLWERAQKRTR